MAHAATNDPFDWSTETDTDQVIYVVCQWLAIARMTDDELDRIGCTWAPEWTSAFYAALQARAVAVLAEAGPEGARLTTTLTENDEPTA